MSQEKVDRYKESKSQRKQAAEKERARKKRNRVIGVVIAVAIVAAIVAAITVTVINQNRLRREAEPDYGSATSYILTDRTGVLAADAADGETEAAVVSGEAETSGEDETADEAESETAGEAESESAANETEGATVAETEGAGETGETPAA